MRRIHRWPCGKSQSREPGFESLGYPFEVWAFSFSSRRPSSLSCVNANLAIDIGGNMSELAGHPRSGCPARLRGHKGSGLWKVWTVPSPPLPSPPLPSPPSPPSLPPSRVPNLIKLGPAIWPKLQPAEACECSAALAISKWTRRLSAMLIIVRRKMLF